MAGMALVVMLLKASRITQNSAEAQHYIWC